jgi:hypothetical protein
MSVVELGKVEYCFEIEKLIYKDIAFSRKNEPRASELIQKIYRCLKKHEAGYWGENGNYYRTEGIEVDKLLFKEKENRIALGKKEGWVVSIWKLGEEELEISTLFRTWATPVTRLWLIKKEVDLAVKQSLPSLVQGVAVSRPA